LSKGRRPVLQHPGRWIVLGVALVVAVAAILLGGPPFLRATGLLGPVASSSTTSAISASVSGPTADMGDQPVTPQAVATPRAESAAPSAAGLAARVKSVSRKGLGTSSVTFMDASTGTVLYGESSHKALAPASNMKVLSTIAALDVLGPDATFTTKVVTPASGQIVLVGGGDPYLTTTTQNSYPARASLQQLAQRTAAALRGQGTTKVTLGYDTSLFTGPSWHPDWTDSYSSEVAHIVPLTADEGRTSEGMPVDDPAAAAAASFAKLLSSAGITVTSTKTTTAAANATLVASVSSPPVSVIVEQILLHSDNDAAEILARHTAIASGQPGSFTGAATAITATLTRLGLLDSGAVVRDGSGLSKSNRVTTDMLARAVRSALHSDTLGAVISGLPLAGVSGTLQTRYSTSAGRGQVWAKTGFLAGTHGLSGILVTHSGAVVVFAMLVNGQADRGVAQPVLDAITSAVVSCGCG
jgi:D-alanyl-D-alanine carboxypeptidase/D-alanyl-D-alanine-endopeptidase (penicillin-binding protein 4)